MPRRTTRPVETNLTIRLSREMRERLNRVAAHQDLAVGTMIRDVLAAWLPEAEKGLPPSEEEPS